MLRETGEMVRVRRGPGGGEPAARSARRDRWVGTVGVLGCAAAVVVGASIPPDHTSSRSRVDTPGLRRQRVDPASVHISYDEPRVRVRLAADQHIGGLLRTARSTARITLVRLDGSDDNADPVLAWIVELDDVTRTMPRRPCAYYTAYAASDGRQLLARRVCH